MTDEEHRAELLQLIKGTPQPEVGIDGFADQMGLSRERTSELIDELIAEGRLRRDDDEDRLIVVEPPG
jgi:DNA-binding IclR family transcriptional regulator